MITNSDIPAVEKKFDTLKLVGVEERFQAGHVGFGAECCGEIVHVSWFSFGDVLVDSLRRKMRLDSESAYLYDGFTLPEHRGLGIWPTVYTEAMSQLYNSKGIKKFYVATSFNNFASLASIKKTDWRKIGAVTYTRILSARLYRLKGETSEDYDKLQAMFPNSLTSRWRNAWKNVFIKKKAIFFEKVLPDPNFRMDSKVNINVRMITTEDIPRIEAKFEVFKASRIQDRFNLGYVGFGAECCGEIVHVSWFSFGDVLVDSLRRKMRLDSESAYVYDGYTLPEYRGLGIIGKTFSESLQYLYAHRGIRKFYVAISHTNFPMQKVVEREGLHKIGAITYTRLIKWSITRFEGESKEDRGKLKKMFSF